MTKSTTLLKALHEYIYSENKKKSSDINHITAVCLVNKDITVVNHVTYIYKINKLITDMRTSVKDITTSHQGIYHGIKIIHETDMIISYKYSEDNTHITAVKKTQYSHSAVTEDIMAIINFIGNHSPHNYHRFFFNKVSWITQTSISFISSQGSTSLTVIVNKFFLTVPDCSV